MEFWGLSMVRTYFLWIAFLSVFVTHSAQAETKPTIVHGESTLADSEAHQQILLSSVRIGKVPVIDGKPNLNRFQQGCSGTVTSTGQVATATHCFNSPPSNWIYYAEVRTSINPDERKMIRITTVNTEKKISDAMDEINADSKKRSLDLALVDLEEAVDEKHVVKVCAANKVNTDSEYVVAGFGATATEVEKTKTLHHTTVRMQQVNAGTFFSRPVRDQVNSSASCYADSGGGLFIRDKDKKNVCLAGTVSGNDQPNAAGSNPELCTRPSLRQIFSRATSERFKNLKVKYEIDPNYKSPPTQVKPGSPGTLPPGEVSEDLDGAVPIKQ